VKHMLRAAGIALTLTCTVSAHAGQRLENIRAKGVVTCGIWPAVAGFAAPEAGGRYHGMDVDVCRAVAAAIFGDPEKVQYVIAKNVGQMKTSDEIDIVVRRITWSLTRATANGLMFGPVTFYDGQGFLVPHKSDLTEGKDLDGEAVCAHAEEAHVETLTSYFRGLGLSVDAVPVANGQEAERALAAGACTAVSADVSMLGSWRAAMKDGVQTYRILPEMISKEPLAPLVRQGDDQFFEIVRWSVFAMIAAEEYGITSQNVDAPRDEFEVQQFLGVVPGNGAALGLKETWARDIVKTVGNYGEVFERNVGHGSAIKLERGLNRLWRDGGLMVAPRLR
jgi:general L-amino acid transport system substrate-binding protein